MEDDSTGPVPDGLTESENAVPPPPSPEDLEKAENLVRQANLAKIRGDKVAYEKLVEEAAQAAPGSSTVQEVLGDAYLERRQVRKAQQAFQMAVKIDPKNISAERKYGETVLSVQLALDPNFGKPQGEDSVASGRAGLLLSFFIPGLGQIVAGETSAGAGLLITWLIGVIWAVAIPGGLAGLATLFGMRGPPFNPVVLVPVFIAIAAWFWSFAEAATRSKKMDKREIVRPVPPVDKEFEL